MTQRLGDMVRETVSAPGTSAFSLGTAASGFLAFSTIPSITTGDTVDYIAQDISGTPWEIGTGTYAAGSLTRTTVRLNSSGTTSTVNFTGTTLVSNVQIAEKVSPAFTKRIVTLSYASSLSINWALYDIVRVTLTGPITITNTGAVDGQLCILELTQDATGGRAVTLGSEVAFGTDIPSITFTTTASKTDKVGFEYNAAASKYHVVAVSRGY